MVNSKGKYVLLMDAIKDYANNQPEHTACVFQTRGIETAKKLTYQELILAVNTRAKLLIYLGYQHKSVALLYPTGLDFVINFLACLLAGVIAVPLNVTRNAKQLERTINIIEDANVQAILTTEDTKIMLSEQLAELLLADSYAVAWITENTAGNDNVSLPNIKPSSLAFIQYTSGSTSNPKGVMVSHDNVVNNMEAIKQACSNKHGVVIGGWLPQFHDMGLVGHMLHPLYMGGTYIFMPPMNFIQRPSRWLHLISHYKIECSASPNFGFEHCVNLISDKEDLSDLDLSCWRVALNGSEPVSETTMSAFAEKFAAYGFNANSFFPTYGMAETTLFVSGGPHSRGVSTVTLDKEPFTQGKIIDAETGIDIVNCGAIAASLTVKIVNPETLVSCNDNTIGEIWVSGSSVAKGYLNNPIKNQSDFNAQVIPADGKRYLRTGDLGFIKSGMLYVTGRIKELLIVRGRNLYPYDIERTCNSYQFSSGGNGSSVFTYQQDNKIKLAAIIEIKKRALATEDHVQISNDIKSLVFMQHEIAFDKLLLVKPGTIPKTTSGKIKRSACIDLI
ncbi:fatty acyl-AMP ligase [Rheinheimera sp. MMS21-TC3]|uniref:fatty acyl-AMP ligase n=1 Tax=Rheinheimera sp. MMS21-TC3 TaxID=3072790 RepID=UPI0028C4F8A6|nr:fatty acyl-AMP ligase [Rheinheimera sp. MMS21-TC3]WNO60626.1 fatty acyl-AMP ligase [Rheinheimera sp. MMS21-TC3]